MFLNKDAYQSIALLVGITLLAVSVDFVSITWLGLFEHTGPDIFPNTIIGIPLIITQVYLVINQVVRQFRGAESNRLALLESAVYLAFVSFLIVIYLVFAWYYQVQVVGRSL